MQTGLNRRLRCNTGARIMSAQTVHWNPTLLKSTARQVICLSDQATTSTLSPTAEAEGEVE